jgi:hypothetical protein
MRVLMKFLNSLSAATETVQSTMDILQAELGNMSKEGEKKTLKLEKFQADFIIHKAGGALLCYVGTWNFALLPLCRSFIV